MREITTIENCRVKSGCEQRWRELTDQGKDNVRYCSVCKESVHWCNSQDEVVEAKSKGWCVAFMTPYREKEVVGVPVRVGRCEGWFTRLMVWFRWWK